MKSNLSFIIMFVVLVVIEFGGIMLLERKKNLTDNDKIPTERVVIVIGHVGPVESEDFLVNDRGGLMIVNCPNNKKEDPNFKIKYIKITESSGKRVCEPLVVQDIF